MSCFNGNGRTDRASLQEATRLALTGTDALLLDTSRASLQVATRLALTGTDARAVRPYSGYASWLRYLSCFDGNGRTDRASLQVAIRLALTGTGAVTFDTTDARIVRPYRWLLVSL